ncbi:MAG TPA: geranylgeranyl reductase family protein [Chitinophagales bacterium]|nr:geranylgeranyl reductase family protein [Chitinophagales bacterium]
MTTETDILIVGAGPAGAAAALFLSKSGISSTVVDKAVFPRDKICGDALSGKVVEVLKKLDENLVDELSADKHFIGSWGVTFVAPNGKALRVPFSSKGKMEKPPGFLSKRLDFDNWLAEKLKTDNHIQLFEKTEIRKYSREGAQIVAETTTGVVYKAKLVIACDGAYSSFSKHIAGLATEPAHNCFGLRAYYKNVEGLNADNFIELHFLKEILPGYFWVFPLPGGYANVGVGMRADKLKQKDVNLKRSFEEILEANPVIKARFANASRVDDVKLFGLPLGSKRRKLSGDNYLLCGDAGQLIDPFTGEGIGNAMYSGMLAAATAQKALQQNRFDAGFLVRYDNDLYHRLWPELLLSYRMQQLVNFPSIFNFVVNKANSNATLRETISGMFEDLDLRTRLKSPSFYLKLLFS